MHDRTVGIDSTVLRFSTDDYAERERVDVWREVLGRTILKLDIEPLSPERFHAEATLRALPGLGILSTMFSPSLYRDGPGLSGNDDIVLSVALTGGGRARQRDREVELGQGDAIVMAGTEAGTLVVPSVARYISLRAPSGTISRLVCNPASYYCSHVPAQSTALRLLTRYVGILDDVEALSTPDLRHHAVAHIHDLMALVIGATREGGEIAKGRGVRAARLRAIKQDIADNLDRADLSAATIAMRHRCTPRYIQMLFEGEGKTFTEYVLMQRLARAHRMLTDPRRAGEKISTLAFEAGFNDLSYFNRAFRRRFSAAPSDVRMSARQLDASR